MIKNKKSGFTLMELIIVIIIIGILIAAIVGLSNLKNIAKASLIYEQGLKIKKTIDTSMKESGEIYYRNFLTNDNTIAKEKVMKLNNFNDKNPFGYEWHWEGETPLTGGGIYSDKLIIKTNVPKDLCETIKERFLTRSSTAVCGSATGENKNVSQFLEVRITFDGE